jgi:putative hydrolase
VVDGPPDRPGDPDDPSNPDDAASPDSGMPFFLGGFDPSQLDLGEVMRLMQSPGPVNWAVARQVATAVARDDPSGALGMFVVGGAPPPQPAPDAEPRRPELTSGQRAEVESELVELVRAAEVLVTEETGLVPAATAPRVVTRAEWADATLDGLAPVLERLAGRLGELPAGGFPVDEELGAAAGQLGVDPAALFGQVMPMLAPLLLGMQAGFMAGQLARQALSRHDLPLPLAGEPRILLVADNVVEFEQAWELPTRDFRFAVALHEVVHAALRSIPWLRDHLVALAEEYVSGYRVDPRVIEDRLGTIDPSDPESFEQVLGDPDALLGALATPAQQEVLLRLQTLYSLLEGYADHVLDQVGGRFLAEAGQIREARRRHRVVQDEAERFIARMLGVELRREHYDRGAAFCQGVVERAGAEALHGVWTRIERLPTPNELAAPGLWLARLEITD